MKGFSQYEAFDSHVLGLDQSHQKMQERYPELGFEFADIGSEPRVFLIVMFMLASALMPSCLILDLYKSDQLA